MHDVINRHPRLLRSLSFGDDDYGGCVLTLLKQIVEAKPSNYKTVTEYLARSHPDDGIGESVSTTTGGTRQIVFTPEVFKVPDEGLDANLVSIMMPFNAGTQAAADSIKAAATAAGFTCQRADDLWKNSVLIQDIFELIFRSYVVVCDFSVEEIEEIYEMRAILQGEAARRIPLPAPRSLISQLEAIHAKYSENVDKLELKATCTLNNAFHETMFGACNNRYLTETIQKFWTRTTAIRCYAIGDPELLQQSRLEHRAMIDAIKDGNREELVKQCVDHIFPALEAYKRAHGGWDIAATGHQRTAPAKIAVLARR